MADHKSCMICKEDFNPNNVFSKEGAAETRISGLCEVCFDNTCFDIYENLSNLTHIYAVELHPVRTTEGCFLAGGALRILVDADDELKDLDLFFTGEDSLVKTIDYFEAQEKFKNIFACPKRELFTYINETTQTKVQLVAKEFYTPEQAIASFDITACCAAWDGQRIYKQRRFVSDVLNKRIHLNNIAYPNATMRRMNKYSHKGYLMTKDAIECFVGAVNSMELTEDNMEFYVD